MTDQLWTITLTATGEVVDACVMTSGPDAHPKDCGWDWDEALHTATTIGAPPKTHLEIWDGSIWAPNPAALRDVKWTAAKEFYTLRCNSGFAIPGIGTIQTDPVSREAIDRLVRRAERKITAGEAWSTSFKNEANEQVPVTAGEIMMIGEALEDFLGLCYTIKEAIGDALNNLLSGGAPASAILSVDVTEGYPPLP